MGSMEASYKKRLLIVLPSYRWGGDSTALSNLLERIDTDKFSIDIFPIIDEGSYKSKYKNCTFLNGDFAIEAFFNRFVFTWDFKGVARLFIKIIRKITPDMLLAILFRRAGKRLVRRVTYDAVISWTEFEPTTFVSHIPHHNKFAWIHCDYTENNHSEVENRSYKRIDRIVCVSKFGREVFIKTFPELKERVEVLYNVLDTNAIIEKSKEIVEDFPGGDVFTIVSYGRIAPSKQFSFIPGIAMRILDRGVKDFHWIIMGPNQHPYELMRIQANIERYGVKDYVEYIGSRLNPFPYIKKADLVVNTTRTEALPYSILEPKVLGVPTINNCFPSAFETITDGNEGLIVPLEEMPATIVSYMKDLNLRQKLTDNAGLFRYDDSAAIKGFESFFI